MGGNSAGSAPGLPAIMWLQHNSVLFVFVSLGWVAGTSWFLAAFTSLWVFSRVKWLGHCIRYGFVKGAGHRLVPNKE